MDNNPENNQWLRELAEVAESCYVRDLAANLMTTDITASDFSSTIIMTHGELREKNDAIDKTKTTYIQGLKEDFADRFPRFDELPPCVRVEIWKLAQPQDRVIEMRISRKAKSTVFDLLDPEFPVLLHVNRESRGETMRSYQRVFLDSTKQEYLQRPLYFNPMADTLFIRSGPEDALAELRRQVLENLSDKKVVKRLAVDQWAVQV